MHLVSTRDTTQTPHSYTDVLLAGLAPDGGLYIPSAYPQLDQTTLEGLKGQSYPAVALAVKQLLVGDAIPATDLKRLIDAAYTTENFPDVADGNITPVRPVKDGLYLQNLSLGPTAAFKDMAMQLLGQEMNYELERRNQNLRILGATSGDTGSAAEAAMKGLSRIQLFMLSPEVGMSDFQKAQMGALSGDNIFNISIRGRFDDCQDLVKAVNADPDFSDLGAVNSINWGRISAQVAYYVAGYLQVAKTVGDPVDFVVPSGNFGNVLAGYVAKQMGVPIRRLIVATNENSVLHELFTTGVYRLTPAQVTSSPSMDISKASNYERLAFDLLGGDAEKVTDYMKTFAESGSVDLASYGLTAEEFTNRGFSSSNSTHADRLAAIKTVHEMADTVIDPHTADGMTVALRQYDQSESVPMVCMETALPVKFEATIQEALGFVPERPEKFVDLESQSGGGFAIMEAEIEELKEFVRENSKM